MKKEFKDYKYYLERIQYPCLSLRWTPYEYRSKEICEIAVKNYWKNLKYVPEELKTRDMCKEALGKWGFAVKFIPKEMIDDEMYDMLMDFHLFLIVPIHYQICSSKRWNKKRKKSLKNLGIILFLFPRKRKAYLERKRKRWYYD